MSLAHSAHYNDITHKVVQAALAIHRKIGPGRREHVYQSMLTAALVALGFSVEVGKATQISTDSQVYGWVYPDQVVNGVVVVECKAAARRLTPLEVAQVLTYLAVSGLPVGLLLNFGRRRLEFKRIFPPQRPAQWRRYVAPYLRRRSP